MGINFSSTKKYQFKPSGGDSILNQTYGPAWAADTIKGRSAKNIYDKIQTIGAGFGNTAYVRIGGDDATGTLGNFLLPFATIGAAISALGTLSNSALSIDSGSYFADDTSCPFGLKPPGSKFDIYCAVGCTISYTGTYGMICMDGSEGTSGNIYGYGNFISYSSVCTKAVNGVSNYAFNWSASSGTWTYEFNNIFQDTTSGTVGLFRIGDCNSIIGAALVNVRTRCYSRGTTVIKADSNSRCEFFGSGTYDAVENGYAIDINNTISCTIRDTTVTARGTAFGKTNTNYTININNTSNGILRFKNVAVTCINSPVGYALINFSGVTATMDNLTFEYCKMKSKQSSSFSSAGNSLLTASNCAFKIIDTYAEMNTGGAGVITNLIGAGNGFMVEPNI